MASTPRPRRRSATPPTPSATIRDRYREAYHEELARWHRLRDDLDSIERIESTTVGDPPGAAADPADAEAEAAVAAEAGAEDARERTMRAHVETLAVELGLHQAELAKLDLAQRNLESTWLFLERGDVSLITDRSETEASPPTDVQMRIVEAQEAERSRLAQEVHDGPAQALSNAIFQVEYIERVLDQDIRLARTELRFLRDLLRRELGDVRGFIAQLRPPLLEQLGLEGAIGDIVATMSALTGLPIETSFGAPADRIDDASADCGPARGTGGPSECTQACDRESRHRGEPRDRATNGSSRSATMDAVLTLEPLPRVVEGTSDCSS